jgi:phage internal scaffolding protein
MPKKAQSKPRCFAHPRANRVITNIEGPSLTKTDQAKHVEVNNIIKRYARTGVIDHLRRAEGVYADVSEIGSYQEAMQTVLEARESFEELPSGLRSRFGNDPAAFVDWATSATTAERDELYAEVTGVDRHNDARPTNPPDSPPAEEAQPSD